VPRRADVGTATCIPANQPGAPVDFGLVERDVETRLSVRIPNTDALVGSPSMRTLAGR
jgi:hypothetical protein